MGKITVKHYLNTKLKPRLRHNFEATDSGFTAVNKGGLVKTFPLYVSAIAKSKTRRFKSKIFDYYRVSGSISEQLGRGFGIPNPFIDGYFSIKEFEFLKKNDKEFSELLNHDLQVVHDTIQAEISENEENISKGFSELYDELVYPVKGFMEYALRSEFIYTIISSNKFQEFHQILYLLERSKIDFIIIYNNIKSMCTTENGIYTPFWKFAEKNTNHILRFYEFFTDYISGFPNLSLLHWRLEGHSSKFYEFLKSKNPHDDLLDGYHVFIDECLKSKLDEYIHS